MWGFKNRTVFFKWFLSYLLVLGLAVLFSIGIYFHFHNIINRQSEEITTTLLDKMQAEIDARFRSARLNLVNLMLDSDGQRRPGSTADSVSATGSCCIVSIMIREKNISRAAT